MGGVQTGGVTVRVWMVGGSRGKWGYERVLKREDIGEGRERAKSAGRVDGGTGRR